jgi:hypothetical protein
MKRTLLISCLILFFFVSSRGSQSMLTRECTLASIPDIFVEGHSWIDLPKYENRNFWNNISPDLKGIIIERGVKASKTPPVTLTGYDYLLFKQGDTYDIVSQKILSKKNRLEDLMIAEIVEGKGRFLTEISNSVWDLCALTNWTGPESQFIQTGQFGLPSIDRVIVDELTGEIAGVLAWAYYYFEAEFNKIDPSISNWIITSIKSKFLSPNNDKYDFYWMCFQTKNISYQTPWISYNWLLANLIVDKNNQQRKNSVFKALECLDFFYKQIPSDGACTGGAEIWQYASGKFFQSLELLDLVTVGEIDIYSDEILKKMGEYITSTHISDNYYFNYSECAPKLTLPASLIYRFGDKVGSETMKSFASHLARQIVEKNIPLTGDLYNKLRFVTDYDKMMETEAKEPLLADVYMKESQVVTARSKQGSREGFFFGVKGGYNNEFGNQNDAGSFVLYANGKPLIVDPGATSKTAKSINNERYSIWANQSAWHNLPTINGRMQKWGANHRTTGMQYSSNTNEVNVSLNLAYAFELSAGIENWIRNYKFNRNTGLEISDRFNLNKVEGETFVSFIAYSKPSIINDGSIVFEIDGSKYKFGYNPELFSVSVNEINVKNDPTLNEWGSNLYRIILKPNTVDLTGTWVYTFKKV